MLFQSGSKLNESQVRVDRENYREKVRTIYLILMFLICLQDYFENESVNWDEQKLARVMTERARSQAIASSKFLV